MSVFLTRLKIWCGQHPRLPEVSALGFEILREYLPIGLAWSIRSTRALSFLLLISLLIWRGQTAKTWLRKPDMSWTAPTSPWKQSGNQEGISYLISGISQVTILRCRGRQEGFPVGPKRVPTTTRGTAENRAGRAFSETMYVPQSRLSVLPQSDCVIKGRSLVSCSYREKKVEKMKSDSTWLEWY